MSNIQLIIEERAADIGNFMVGRLLPFRKKRMVGPFIYIDHMGPVKLNERQNFDVLPHPHIGLSTLTFLFEGSIMHRDTLGNEVEIKPGAVNWMTAGKGIVHSERTPEYLRESDLLMHGLQIWVALPKDLEQMDPQFSHIEKNEILSWSEGDVAFKLVAGDFPLIVIVHGNGHLYTDYIPLAKFLAKNGFIVSTISLLVQTKKEYDVTFISGTKYKFPLVDSKMVYYDDSSKKLYWDIGLIYELRILGGITFNPSTKKLRFNIQSNLFDMHSVGRAELLYEHLIVLKSKYGNSLQNNFGIMGHSRGGEAVVHAARKILDTTSEVYINKLQPIGLYQLNAVVSLAPTDQLSSIAGNPREKLDKDVPFFTLYGSRDHDVRGYFDTYDELTAYRPIPKEDNSLFMGTSFSLYDNAIGGGGKTKFKTSIFIKGATHNGFMTKNDLGSVSVIDVATQKRASFACFNAFFRLTLFNEEYWQPYFTGELIPDSITTNDIQFQFERYTPGIVIDDMQTGSNWSLGSGGGIVSLNGSTTQPVSRIVKGDLRRLDSDLRNAIQKEGTSPHLISGIRIYWQANDILVFDVPPSLMNILSFDYLSFKIANGTRREDIKGMRVGIRDSVDVEAYHALKPISKPDMRNDIIVPYTSYPPSYYNADPTKNVLETIRIPLSQFQSAGVDLATVKKIIFCFPTEKGKTGKVNLSNLIITN